MSRYERRRPRRAERAVSSSRLRTWPSGALRPPVRAAGVRRSAAAPVAIAMSSEQSPPDPTAAVLLAARAELARERRANADVRSEVARLRATIERCGKLLMQSLADGS
jgi:hypothetical protein